MKAIFVSCNQALMAEALEKIHFLGLKGYSLWEETLGCGMANGEPHLGDNIWPTMNASLLTFIEDDSKADSLMAELKELDAENPQLGLRAFWWNVGGTL